MKYLSYLFMLSLSFVIGYFTLINPIFNAKNSDVHDCSAHLHSESKEDAFKLIEPFYQDIGSQFYKGTAANGEPLHSTCLAPGTPESYINKILEKHPGLATSIGRNNGRHTIFNRWGTTATDGSGLEQGDATTLTWSYVPDGTVIVNNCFQNPGDVSDFINFFNGLYGSPSDPNDLTTAPWHQKFVDMFADWAEKSGLTFVYEPNDDGLPYCTSGNPGMIGIRGDIRIGGAPIDGNNGILACNYYPNNGDMIIDTDDNWISMNLGLGTDNLLAHEIGHALGLDHVCPHNETKLMEPFISTAYDGPQEDDILGVNRSYGDFNIDNGSSGTATYLGLLPNNGDFVQQECVSIDDFQEKDYYEVEVDVAGSITFTMTPTGTTYLEGPQNVDGSCSEGSSFNALIERNLDIKIISSNGMSVLAQGSGNPAGVEESETFDILTAGTYFIRVEQESGGPGDDAQMYELTISFIGLPCDVGEPCDDGDDCTTGETYDADCNCSGGVFQDEDEDGVCDAEDQCPDFDNNLIGTACDDGNDCTIGETYDDDCNCSGGVYTDADGDGFCVGFDPADNDPCIPGFLLGSPVPEVVNQPQICSGDEPVPFLEAMCPVGPPCVAVANPGFETGDYTDWDVMEITNPFIPATVECGPFTVGFGFTEITAFEGSCYALNGFDGEGPGIITTCQTMEICSNSTTFSWSHWLAWDLVNFNNGMALDRMLDVTVDGTSLYSFTASAGTIELGTGWVSNDIDISAYAGQTVEICFEENIPELFTGPAQIGIDGISLDGNSDSITNWYDQPVGGDLQGTGNELDPVGTTAQEGPFDANTPGVYTYYAECTYSNGCVSQRTPVTITVNALPEAPIVVNEPQICEGDVVDPTNLLEVECPMEITLDPAAGYISFMNVFDDPSAMDMSCGGGYCFGVFNWGFNGFDHPDLVATFNGDELTLQGTPLPDPSPYWYDTPGGPGVIGNNIMEANHFVEDQSGQYNGSNLSYSVEVASIDFSCGHETSLYIREFAPGFAFIINETFVPLTGTGVFTVTMPISATPGNIVQYGHQTVGNNLWPTDVDGCGSAVLLPVENTVTWYDAPVDGNIQGTGLTLNPTGTTAEEGPFDPNVAGTYTYYAECTDGNGCVSERTPVVFTVNANPAAPVVVNQPQICEGDVVDPTNLLEVECPMAITLDPAAGYISFMNVFDDPNAQDMSCGGGYCFGVFNWGFNGFDHPDLVATFNGDELTLQGTPLPDPSPYWYDTPGGPGVIGNNIMEANHFVEDQSGQYNGSNLSYSVEVASIDFSCGHETSLYIREFAPGFAFIINETFVPLTGTGVFTVTMPISATPGNIVQYGHQTVGNNLWPTDVDGCGSAVLLPVENTVTWYNAPVGGDVQGNGLTLDPTGTTAEEGAFDPNTAGSYTYYAECMDGNGCVSERTPVVFTVQMVPEPPVVVNEPVVCDGGPIDPNNLLEAECPTVMTLDPNAGYISFMNVFDDPNAQDMSCGGGYCFGVFNWGFNGFDHPDLVATFNGDELTLQGTPLPDPSAYWYDTPGGPGVIGNNIMEANHFVEDPSGQFLGTDLSYAVEVLSIDFSCGHETSIYIREFTPGFALVNEAMVPLTGPGIFTVTMPISNTPGHIVQYGHQTVGNNLWPTDVDGCGAAILAPATPEVAWYNAETGGDLQGMGEQFDPTGTTAEQGPFDINTPGEYCYYAECVAEYSGCSEAFTDGTFSSPDQFSGNETFINFDDIATPGGYYQITGNEYAAQGVSLNATGTSLTTVFSGFGYPSPPNVWFSGPVNGGPHVPLELNFSTTQNRIGFQIYTNPGSTELTITCSSNGTIVGQETFVTGLNFSYFGLESMVGFDQVTIDGPGNDGILIDDLSFEGCTPFNPQTLTCESERTKFTFTVVGFDNLTATQICNYTSTDLPHDYDIELCFDVLQGGPSGLFDVYVDDGDSPNMINIDEYNGAQQDNFAYDDLGPSIDGSANNCVILNSADFNASDLSNVTVSIIDWDVANMENGTTADIACSSIDFEEFLCCNPDAGTQSEGPIEVCTDVETSLAPAGTVGTVDVTFENLPQEPEAGVNNYAWIITDSNLDIVNVVGSENYDVDNPVSFSDDILLSDASGNMLGIGTYCIHGINYRDASIAANANMQGTIDLAGLQGLVGTNAANIVNELLENDGVLTMSGADGTFTVCADLNVQGCTPVIINPTPEITVQPEDDYVCEGDDAVFTVSAFVLPGDHLDPNPSTLNFVIEWSQDEGTSWNEFPAAIADPEQPILGPTGEETVNFTIPGVTIDMNCSLWRVVVTAEHNPEPFCSMTSEEARLFVHNGGQMQCNNKVNYSFDENCEINPSVTDFFEGDFDACDVDIHTYMNTFYRVEFETFGGIPVAAEDLSEQLSYGGGCLIYNVIDNCTGNSCWGEICVEDKLPPEIECPCPPGAWITDPTCQIDCSDIDRYLNGQRGTPTIFEACEDADAVFGGATATEVECGVYVVTQNWWVETEGPNGQVYSDISCTNEYYVTVPDLMDELDCPDDVEYDCSEDITEESFSPEETGYPEFDNVEINNTVENSYCNIFAAYEDLEVPACDGCYGPVKIFRTWQVINWCTAEISVCEQIIKVTDSTPPSILADDITVSTEPWNCSADVWLPDPQLHDDCDYDLDWCIATTNSGATLVDEDGRTNQGKPLKHALGVPKGTWEFTLKSTDCCGNNGYYTINVTVADLTPPVVVATQNIVVSLTSSGDDWDGSAKIYKDAIDNGSHDNCSGVWAEIRRDEDACDVEGNTTYSNKLPQQCDPWYDNDDHDYGEYVKFCCADLTEIDSVTGVSYGIVKVWMRVWDDGNMDGVYGSYTYYDNPGNDHDYCDLEDNYNEIWVNVRVEDKAPVSLICPPDVTIPCHWDWTDTSITGEAQASATCGHPEVQYTDWPEVHCGEGYVLREWSVEGYEYVCVQRITVTPVETPLEVICPIYEDFAAIGDNPPITWFNPFEPNHVSVDCEDFEFPEPVQYGGKCNLVGVSSTVDTFWFEEDACFKAIKTWHYVDWCTEDEFECEFVVSVIDTEAPMVMCQDTCFAVDDYWDDDEDGNYCELEDDVEVQSMAIDEGDCESIWIKWVATVDYWYDGVIDEEYSSFVAPNDPFYVAPTASGDPVSIELDKDELGGEWARHLVEWKAFDGCGNVDQCVQVVEVADKKAPTPYCVGLSTSIMTPEAGNLVEIWAKDFNLGSFDNCTQEHWLKYTFNEVPPVVDLIDEEHCFKPVWEDRDNCLPLRDENGNIVSEEDNNCSDYEDGATRPDCPLDAVQKWDPNGVDEDGNPCKTSGVKFVGLEWCGVNPIRVSVWDNKFNTDFCWVDLIVHGVECDNTATPRIEGEIATETGANVEGAMVTNSGADLIQTDMTDENGHYAFDFNIMGEDYALAVEKNNDWLNGVSTLDLVLIQQHVLGINELNSGYRLVAADINNDESVSAVDLIELRKLILGIYSDLPNNTSWRFMDAKQSLSATNPWPINEEVNISSLAADMMSEDFVGAKVGDVNGSVIANANEVITESRSSNQLEFVIENYEGSVLVKAGANFDNVYGYQFSMKAEGELSNVYAAALDVSDQNFGVLVDGQITTSFASETAVSLTEGEVLFTLEGVNAIQLINGFTKAEAYFGNDLQIGAIALREDKSNFSYSLSQNEPNPFSETTTIAFTVAKPGLAVLSVYDVTGKVIKTIEADYEKGKHVIQLNKRDLSRTGVLYYQLESGDFTASKKMIIID